MTRRSIPIETRFWGKVDKSGDCWIWQGISSRNGYGLFWPTHDKGTNAHRVAWELVNGPIPDGLWVLHKCDNRRCVNPEHLFLGTSLDNNRDREQKGRGRQQKGEKCGASKLKNEDVIKIRQLYADGNGPLELSKMFGVDKSTIRSIVTRENWKHI